MEFIKLLNSIEFIAERNISNVNNESYSYEYQKTKKEICEVLDYFKEQGIKINEYFLDNWEINGYGMSNIAKDKWGNIIEIDIDYYYDNESAIISDKINFEDIDLNCYWNKKYLSEVAIEIIKIAQKN